MTLAHDSAGAGPAVVLLHSTVCDRRMWDPQTLVLAAAGYRVVRCDFRGFGDTPVPDRPYDNAQDVADLMDALGVTRAAVIGASGGGQVALEVAARWPSRVAALGLLCTAWRGHPPGPALREFGAREEAFLEAGDVGGATSLNVDTFVGPAADARTRSFVAEMQRHAFRVQLAAVEEFPQLRVAADPAAITAPSLLVSGAHDLPDFREIAVALTGRLTGARHVELAWAGHLPSLERPDLLNPILLEFLSGHRPAG